ncbi:hypothetical protein MSAN_00509100 [Mycena sanguinolenta]|uniref:Uncharacterized protein n=1 Tax=Mycena sanguinolenta TaxID=230812 RepID=A0A8H7DH62_9AGAR|nr:hypothetical protein MSAN_00509100 [Mycena sanguinolenta]
MMSRVAPTGRTFQTHTTTVFPAHASTTFHRVAAPTYHPPSSYAPSRSLLGLGRLLSAAAIHPSIAVSILSGFAPLYHPPLTLRPLRLALDATHATFLVLILEYCLCRVVLEDPTHSSAFRS